MDSQICQYCQSPFEGRKRKYCGKACALTVGRARTAARNKALYVPHPRPPAGIRKDVLDMVSMFKNGHTLQAIGDKHGITRERVRQLIKKCGITRKQGGAHKKAVAAQSKKRQSMDARCLEKHGMPFSLYRDINRRGGTKHTPAKFFREHKRNAKNRGIPFEFKFADWWRVWEDSGKWGLRGRSADSYCMCRFDDKGPYSKDNVYIATLRQNSVMGRTIAHEIAKPQNAVHAIVLAAGGRKAVSEATGSPANYISGLAGNGAFPRLWAEDGRIDKIAALTGGKYSAEQIVEMAVAA